MEYATEQSVGMALADESKPVLLQFSADWCGPCRQMAPMVDDVATAFRERLVVLRLNLESHQDLAERYSVAGIPHFILIKDGQLAGRLVGTTTRSRFTAFVEDHV